MGLQGRVSGISIQGELFLTYFPTLTRILERVLSRHAVLVNLFSYFQLNKFACLINDWYMLHNEYSLSTEFVAIWLFIVLISAISFISSIHSFSFSGIVIINQNPPFYFTLYIQFDRLGVYFVCSKFLLFICTYKIYFSVCIYTFPVGLTFAYPICK